MSYVLPAAAQTSLDPASSELFVSVLNRDGTAVHTLSKSSFRVKVNRQPAPVLEASYSLGPRRLAVLLDMSGSMGGTHSHEKWQVAREAVNDVLANTPSDVSIAFLTFSDKVHDVFDFYQTRNSMSAWLKEGDKKIVEKRVKGRTALFDAILATTKMFGPPRAGDAIYVITDAGDNVSHVRAREIRKLLLSSKIRLFVFLLADRPGFFEMALGAEGLEEIARATGGFVFGTSADAVAVDFLGSRDAYEFDDRVREKIKVYTSVLNSQLNGFYTLRFQMPVAKAHKVELDLIEDTGRKMPNVAYTYSTALLP